MANETNSGYLVQLQNPEGDNVYPIIPAEAIKNEDGSTFSPDDIAAKCKPYVSVTKPLLSGSVKAGDIVDYNDTNVIHETKTTYGQNTISHITSSYANADATIRPIPLGNNRFFIAYTSNRALVYSIVEYTESTSTMDVGGELNTITSGTVTSTKRRADDFGCRLCNPDGSLPSTAEEQSFPLHFVLTMTYDGTSLNNHWLGILRINEDYTTQLSEIDDTLSSGSNEYLVGATTLPNNGLFWMYYNNSDDVYKYKYYTVNWDTLSIELKYSITLNQSSKYHSVGAPYYDPDTNKIFVWGDYGTKSSNTVPVTITIDATDLSTQPTSVRTTFSTWANWYSQCYDVQKVGSGEYVFICGRVNTYTPRMYPAKIKILDTGSVEATIITTSISSNTDCPDYNANMFMFNGNVIGYQYDIMNYYDTDLNLLKTITFPDSSFITSSKRYLFPIKRLDKSDGFIVFENGSYYGTFSINSDDTIYTSIYTGSVGSDGIALNDASESDDVEVLVSGTAKLDLAKRGDIFDSSVGSAKNVYGYSTADGFISAIQRNLLIPAGLGAYNFKKIPYDITTSSSKYKIDISNYSTVIVYITASSKEVDLYLDAEFSTTVANLKSSSVDFSMDTLSDITVYTGKVPFVIYPSLGYIQALAPYRYSGSTAYYTMPWAVIADGPITTIAAQKDKTTSGSCSMVIYVS